MTDVWLETFAMNKNKDGRHVSTSTRGTIKSDII